MERNQYIGTSIADTTQNPCIETKIDTVPGMPVKRKEKKQNRERLLGHQMKQKQERVARVSKVKDYIKKCNEAKVVKPQFGLTFPTKSEVREYTKTLKDFSRKVIIRSKQEHIPPKYASNNPLKFNVSADEDGIKVEGEGDQESPGLKKEK